MTNQHHSKAYLIFNEVLNALTHGIAGIASLVGLIFLIVKGIRLDSPLHIISYAIYGSTLFLLFLSSTLYHSLIFTKARKFFKILDHSSIFLLIAGSYTPFCLLSIGGTLGWVLFFVIWSLALGGIIYKVITLNKQDKVKVVSTIIYIVMGWLCIIGAKDLFFSLGNTGTILLVAGGLTYTLGTIFYSLKKVKYMHVVWHFFVMIAAGLMYFSILLYT